MASRKPKARAPKPARTPKRGRKTDNGHRPSASPLLVLPDRTIPLAHTDQTKTNLQREAMAWSYTVRNRKRWAGHDALAGSQEGRARELLSDLGVAEADLRALAHAGAVQVVVPFSQEEVGWESRVLPWEFVLSAATRPLRARVPLVVVRQLRRSEAIKGSINRAPKSVLFVESAPSAIVGDYTFDSERELVRTNLGQSTWNELKNPSRAQLKDAVKKYRPDVIHLAGFDCHQGSRLQRQSDGRDSNDAKIPLPDGYTMTAESGAPDFVAAAELGALLTAGAHRPDFVGCGFWNSASRVAAMIVGSGVRSAVGFQDSFDDNLAELFFATFYRRLVQFSGDLLPAFQDAWRVLRERPRGLLGTGIVLWSGAQLVEGGAAAHQQVLKKRERERKKVEGGEQHVVGPEDVKPADVMHYVTAKADPFEELNYSLLHNRRPLFKKFQIMKGRRAGRISGVDVTVELCAGADSFPFRRTYDVSEPGVDACPDAHVALTPSLVRSLRETVASSLFIEVTWGEHVLYRNTHRVRLLPPDQWRDTDTDRLWLPSFVLPRDSAVGDILEKAQHYVRVLRDDPAAGFDGYQSIDPQREDPTEDVDLQVQAIWSAIVHEWRLGYVNPPPTYSLELDSQRLRTPSAIREDRSGTCIDLSLLFAACLELVDIYPVIFLLKGHAFPGYWRSDEAHDAFRKAVGEGASDGAAPRVGYAGTATEGWVQGKTAYAEIVRQVDEGHLVPIETVRLTEPSGFWSALESGRENLRPKREFEQMIDIVIAREMGVTPIPVGESN